MLLDPTVEILVVEGFIGIIRCTQGVSDAAGHQV